MKRVLIIGASSGIGAAVALRLASRFAKASAFAKATADKPQDKQAAQSELELILHGRDEERLSAVRTKVEGQRTKVSCLLGDVVEWAEDVKSIPAIGPVDGQPSQSSGVQAIVWCAGICELAAGQMIGLKAVRRTLAVNLEAPLVVLSYFYRKGIIQSGGRIVLLGSASAHDAGEGFSVYAASKGGLASAARVLGKEFARKDIQVHCLEPGTVDTPMTQKLVSLFSSTRDEGPFGRLRAGSEPRLGDADFEMVSADEVAEMVTRLILPHLHGETDVKG